MKNQSYERIFRFDKLAGVYLGKKKENKINYAIKKVLPELIKKAKEYNEGVEDIEVQHCAVDDKGIILRDANGNMSFTREGKMAANKAVRKLLLSTVPFEQFIVKDLPDDLTEQEREAFDGFILINK